MAFLQSTQGRQGTDGCSSSLTFLFRRASGEGEEGFNDANAFHKNVIFSPHLFRFYHGQPSQLPLNINYRLLHFVPRYNLFQECLLMSTNSVAMDLVGLLVYVMKRRSFHIIDGSLVVSKDFP